jgi:hypothetical protein
MLLLGLPSPDHDMITTLEELPRLRESVEASQAAYEGSIPFARSKPQAPINPRHSGLSESISVLLVARAGRKQDVDCGKCGG